MPCAELDSEAIVIGLERPRALCSTIAEQSRRLPRLILLMLIVLAPAFHSAASAEPIRVSAQSDKGMDPVQGRQQAQERAFVEAVFKTAQNILPAPLSAPRSELLRQFLASRAAPLVHSFQEAAAAKPGAAALSEKTQAGKAPSHASDLAAATVALELTVEVDRTALRELLTRLGLLSGGKHPGGFMLSLGRGMSEADLKPLADVWALQGVARQAQAPLRVTLERVPQGYLKAVLWQDAKTYVADGQDVAQVWLDLWGRFFSAHEQQPGGSGRPLEISGFTQVDAVLEFTKTLQGWDDCLREVRLGTVDIRQGNSTAIWSARVTNPERLATRLKEYLPSRKLTAIR